MKIKPILTEKSIKEVENGRYSFWVPKKLNKGQIKALISRVFDVKVKSINTMNYKPLTKRNARGKMINTKARKKAVVTLGDKQTIDLFGENKK